MPNNRKDFSDKEIKCKKCFAPVGWQRLNAQCLVIGSLCFFNFCRFACLRCEAINGWQSVNLLPDEKTALDGFPDSLRDVPQPDKRIVNQLGARGVTRMKNGRYAARIVEDGKHRHLGCYSSIEAASAAYKKAKSFAESR
jgi:hypothetical protein